MTQSDVRPEIDVLVPLAAAPDEEVTGGKAAALAGAIARGHRVPDGFVLPVGARPTEDLGVSLARAVERLGGSVAVRSSAVGEDSADLSYAGQYETVLGVTVDTVVDAVRRCRDSADSTAVHSYATHAHVAEGEMAVLIQRMVDPDAAGVAFSIDPITGRDHVVIEATAGVGDALLAGEVTGERWTVDDRPVCLGQAGGVLDEQQAREIAALCHRLVGDTGGPVLDRFARVVAIVTSAVANSTRLRLAIPINYLYSETTGLLQHEVEPVSYTHLTLPTIPFECRSRWSPYH